MTEGKARSAKVGDLVDVKEGATVVRPDGTELTVTGGSYVIDVPGTHAVDGTELKAK